MSDVSVCQTKRHFDTEFEATLYANKVELHYGEAMMPYKCGPHWHITHADPAKSRGVGHKYWRCPKCKQIMKQEKAAKHKCIIGL